ncbi:unnamed protein product [Rodentolepis nana]|uniref:Uncharacterized protein n=1 Tax=Rodentolepis nana TaxID=102285 RepID=A0A3P7RTP2_RODNA|nr:unnamed protein product [Rodentolepis nana]
MFKVLKNGIFGLRGVRRESGNASYKLVVEQRVAGYGESVSQGGHNVKENVNNAVTKIGECTTQPAESWTTSQKNCGQVIHTEDSCIVGKITM